MNVKAVRSLKSTEGSMGRTKRYQQMQEEEYILDPNNPVKLYDGPIIDTTDRSLVEQSQTLRFDPAGFKFDRPLQKDIFHADPYITCANCNYLSFVDVATVRRMLALPATVSAELRLAPEILPPCVMCHCSDSFVVGSHDFTELIEERKRWEAERVRREQAAAIRIQQSYRRYLRRMYGAALCDMFLANLYLRHVAALKITSAARGRLARRIARTERALKIIKSAHPLLVRHSLRTTLRGPKVFWYKRQVEIDMLFRNYLELVKKTGFVPPRKLVEDNAIEIARRVLERQNQLVVLVQRRWRGFIARRIVRYFRTEITRLFQFQVSRVMKIQRVYRGHAVRLRIPALIAEWERKEVLEDYLAGAREAELQRSRDKAVDQVRGFYRKERAEERTARFTSRIAAAEHFGMQKMAAFWDSPYADDRLGRQIDKVLAVEDGAMQREAEEVARQQDRRVFIENRVAEHGPGGFGWRGVPTLRPPCSFPYDAVLSPQDLGLGENLSAGINLASGFMATVSSNSDTLSSLTSARGRSFRAYFAAELQLLTELAVQRLQHDFSKRGLLRRLKDFNEDRFRRLRALKRHEARQERLRREAEAAAAGLVPLGVSPIKLREQRRRSMVLQEQQLLLPSAATIEGAAAAAAASTAAAIASTAAAAAATTGRANRRNSMTRASVELSSASVKVRNALAAASSDARRKELALRGNYKYPEHIYFNAMEWLYEDYDV